MRPARFIPELDYFPSLALDHEEVDLRYPPDGMSQATIEELGRIQANLLDSITESPEETAYRNACYDSWVKSCHKSKKTEGIDGSSNPQQS